MFVARPEKRAYSRDVSDRKRRLYLSAEEVALGGGAKRLISVLQRVGIEMFWSQIRTGGPRVIGHEINASNGVLALVNANWATSTYHSAEISFALGETSYYGEPTLKHHARSWPLSKSRSRDSFATTGCRAESRPGR
jgi:hypothetical protein